MHLSYRCFPLSTRAMSMQTSSRNQFSGTVSTIIHGAVNAEVEIDIGNGLSIIAIITNGGAERLGLEKGREVIALIKASSVILTSGAEEPSSARNKLCGKVVSCREGAVNAEVSIQLADDVIITAIITNESVHRLDIREDKAICAMVKASSVIVAVPI